MRKLLILSLLVSSALANASTYKWKCHLKNGDHLLETKIFKLDDSSLNRTFYFSSVDSDSKTFYIKEDSTYLQITGHDSLNDRNLGSALAPMNSTDSLIFYSSSDSLNNRYNILCINISNDNDIVSLDQRNLDMRSEFGTTVNNDDSRIGVSAQ